MLRACVMSYDILEFSGALEKWEWNRIDFTWRNMRTLAFASGILNKMGIIPCGNSINISSNTHLMSFRAILGLDS